MKKPYTKPEVTAPNEPDYDAELTKFENLLLRDLEREEIDVMPEPLTEYRRRKIAVKLALAFSLGAHYGYRYAGGEANLPTLGCFDDTCDPAGEPYAR